MKTTLVSLALALTIPAAGWLAWRHYAGAPQHPAARKVLYYQDSMHPWIKSDKPGKCTVCGMDLTPIYEGQSGFSGAENVVVLSSNSVTVLNVQTEEVKRRTLCRVLRVAGLVDANEEKKAIVSAPTGGRVEETAINYAGVEVRQGERLLTFYSPELTQQKYRYLVRAQRATDQRDPTGGLASQKGDADPYYTDLVAPLTGTVIERNVSRGQYVAEGERLFTIADASVLWYRFDVYEQQLPWLRLGQKVMVSLPALPGETFEAVISFIDPMLDPATRAIKVRADLANPPVEINGTRQRRFKFGMYAEGLVRAEVTDRLAVPRSAVLSPGKTAYAYVDKGDGAYERRVLKLGPQGDDLCEVRAGLEEGERVVTSGNVLLDAQAQFGQAGADALAEDDTDGNAAAVAADAPPAQVLSAPAPALMAMAPPAPPPDDAAPAESHRAPAEPAQSAAAPVPANRHLTAPMMPSGGRGLMRGQSATPDPIPTGGRRQLGNWVFVRMAERRNAELDEQRAANAAATNAPGRVAPPHAANPVTTPPETLPAAVAPAAAPAVTTAAGHKTPQASGEKMRQMRLAALKAHVTEMQTATASASPGLTPVPAAMASPGLTPVAAPPGPEVEPEP